MSTNQSSTILLTRLLSLKENSPFLLVIDSLAQTSFHFLNEIISRISSNTKVIYLSFETTNRPAYATEFIECLDLTTAKILELVKIHSTSSQPSSLANPKTFVIIDSLNYVSNLELSSFITGCISPNVCLLGCFHSNIPEPQQLINTNYPSSLSILSFIASSIFEIDPLYDERKIDEETLENSLSTKLKFPINCNLNSEVFKVTLKNRRKSGRSLTFRYILNTSSHTIEVYTKSTSEQNQEEDEEELLKDLTTFNLTTNSKQKIAREQVDLPFMQAQEALGSAGGAIVYEFEKDDDYDEDDPYEDPF
ncbi:elongator complex protein 5 [[Candida] railenensis]|uniref:Elongator complex protein 5 n=1 Tax=[Candida] railenensis TaxID=45579 RepID=A0A9P0QUG9_9ASCO|nr:elongator complex protein 5 [[Candida] railenensis]